VTDLTAQIAQREHEHQQLVVKLEQQHQLIGQQSQQLQRLQDENQEITELQEQQEQSISDAGAISPQYTEKFQKILQQLADAHDRLEEFEELEQDWKEENEALVEEIKHYRDAWNKAIKVNDDLKGRLQALLGASA
jgi:DNA repair exonuclease SbcCD ATPase subunit